jgi:TonB family protein
MKGMLRAVSVTGALLLSVAASAMGQALQVAKSQAPIRLSAPSTRYPDDLRRSRIEGSVLVEARIDSTGRVEAASLRIVETSDPRFDEAAREFVANSRYRPARVDGHRVAMFIRVPVTFDLHGLSR